MSHRLSRLLLAAVVSLLPHGASVHRAQAAAAEQRPVIFAVVVGHNDGWGVLPQLRYADDDALRFYQLALQLTERRKVALLTELDVDTWRRLQHSGTPPPPFLPPTKSKLQRVITLYKQQIAALRKKHPERPVHLFFFFSGHGERGYFFLKRSGSSRRGDAFTGDDLRRAFAGSRATLNGLFIDACKSQSLFVNKGGVDDKELGPDFSGLIDKVDQAARQTPIGVLTSTVSDRPAGEAEDIRGGYFSHVLTSGLSGAADANSDGMVRYDELAAFVAFHTRRISGQQPWFRPPRGKLKTLIVDLRGRRGLIEIPPGVGGHFAVLDAKRGSVRLEVHKTEAQWTRLIVGPGRYRVVWVRSARRGLMASVSVGKTAKNARLMLADFAKPVSLGVLAIPKGAGLGAPTSAPTALDQTLQTFNPARSGFDQPFTPRVVATLAVAYSSGLTAKDKLFERSVGTANNLLSAGYGYFVPPVEPAGSSHAFTIAYARRLGRWQLGVRGTFALSDHVVASTSLPFRMHRLMVQTELHYALPLRRWLEVAGGTYAGWQMTLVTRDTLVLCGEFNDDQCNGTALHGDVGGFRAGLSAAARASVAAGVYVSVAGGVGFEVVRQEQQDGETSPQLFWRPHVIGQVGYAF